MSYSEIAKECYESMFSWGNIDIRAELPFTLKELGYDLTEDEQLKVLASIDNLRA